MFPDESIRHQTENISSTDERAILKLDGERAIRKHTKLFKMKVTPENALDIMQDPVFNQPKASEPIADPLGGI